jgi:ribose transport system ATP-binding protein
LFAESVTAALQLQAEHEASAAKIGIRTSWVIVGPFLASSLLTVLGGVMVMSQLGIGDPNQGVEYTLGSVAAVVLGGASLFGGRGSFLGVLFGALLIQEVNSATTFLGLSQAWQYWFIGLLTLCAVAVYSQAAIIQSKSLAEIDGQELRVREPPPPFSYGVRRKRPPAG